MPTKKIEEAEEVTRCPECNSGHLSFDYERGELVRMASGMGLPRNVRETAAMVYRKAVNKNLIRGRSIEGVVAASLYAACRQCNVPRTLDEIANSSRVGRKEIGRTYRFMTRELKLKLMPTKPQDYVSRFCSELKLTGEVQSRAVEILKEAQDKELTSGRAPTGVAAGSHPQSRPHDEDRRSEGHHELLAEDRHVRGFGAGGEHHEMIREDRDEHDETTRDGPTEQAPPSPHLEPILNAPIQEEGRGQT